MLFFAGAIIVAVANPSAGTPSPTLVAVRLYTPTTISGALPVVPSSAPSLAPVSPQATASTMGGLTRAKLATVAIIVPVESDPGHIVSGSGSIITHEGHILTNRHLFYDDTGAAYNNQGDIYIAILTPDDLKGEAQIRYRAKPVQMIQAEDLALIRITSLADGSPLPSDLGLSVIPIGDSKQLDSGDELTILGYPGLGGNSLTLTSGKVAGFIEAEHWIKTDAEINPGNSGGPALNAANKQIGVASATNTGQKVTGKLGLIRDILYAQPLIELARSEAGE
ncbi:MAG: serine protease [Anaerolineae bacterium]